MEPLLEIEDLRVQYITCDGVVEAVNSISLRVDQGETLGLVGETGAGKTTTALSILRLLPDPPGKIVGGDIRFRGESILEKSEKEMHGIRGGQISMIFQDPMTALNPVIRVGEQIAEVILLHNRISKAVIAYARIFDSYGSALSIRHFLLLPSNLLGPSLSVEQRRVAILLAVEVGRQSKDVVRRILVHGSVGAGAYQQ